MTQNIDITLTFDDLLNAVPAEPQWILALIEEGVIEVQGRPESAQFSGFQMARVRRAYRLQRDFETSMPSLALIMRLLDEVEDLRKQVKPISLLGEQ